MEPEIEALRAVQAGQRQHVLGILEGMTDADLRRAVLPSGWTCLGMVNHLALDVERFWFRAVIAGERAVIDELATTDDAWLIEPGVHAEQVFDRYRRECTLADAVIAEMSTSNAPAWWPDELFGSWRLHSSREILLHVITETACHAGHLDAARELVDGRTWLTSVS